MSDKKFNLKNYKKTNGDEHIDMRLEEARSKAPDVINEKQLEDYRGKEENVVIEKLLEKNRTGEETEITEKRLDTHKSKFANKYRNEDAYTGDMNKLEEKRLTGDTNEKEKYESASETAKQFRWWEGVKSPDGLKVAQKKTEKIVEAAIEKDEEDVPEAIVMEEMPQDDFNIEEIERSQSQKTDYSQFFYIKEKRFLPNKFKWLSGVYMVLEYDPLALPLLPDGTPPGIEEIKQGALGKITSVYPELADVIDDTDLHIKEIGGEGFVKLMAHKESLAPAIDQISAKLKGTAEESAVPSQAPAGDFEEVSYEEKDVTGTPMATGRVKINIPVNDENRNGIIDGIVDFIKSKHPGIQIETDSLNLSSLSSGQVEYMVGMGNDAVTADSDFDIIVESEVSKKN